MTRRRAGAVGAGAVVVVVLAVVGFQLLGGPTAPSLAPAASPVADAEAEPGGSSDVGDPEDGQDVPQVEEVAPPDPSEHDVADLLPDGHAEMGRLVVADPVGFVTLSLPAGDDPRPVTATLFTASGEDYEVADAVTRECGYEPSAEVDEDGEVLFVDCHGGATAQFLWAFHRDGDALWTSPDPDLEPTGWLHSGWELDEVEGDVDQLTLWLRDCIPTCIETGLIGTHLTFETDTWLVGGCTAASGERVAVPAAPEVDCGRELVDAGLVAAACVEGVVTADDVVGCLLGAVEIDDLELAGKLAEPWIVDQLVEWMPDDGFDWTFSGCGDADFTCWLYEESDDPAFHGVSIEFGYQPDGPYPYVTSLESYG